MAHVYSGGGGLVAGCILLFLKKRMPGQATEYMEAMSIGNGLIKFRPPP